jgi:hypothetical protein
MVKGPEDDQERSDRVAAGRSIKDPYLKKPDE